MIRCDQPGSGDAQPFPNSVGSTAIGDISLSVTVDGVTFPDRIVLSPFQRCAGIGDVELGARRRSHAFAEFTAISPVVLNSALEIA